jgi:hypothetical protein
MHLAVVGTSLPRIVDEDRRIVEVWRGPPA